MRKSQKQEILELIDTLNQAHDEIAGYMESGKYDHARDMLVQCQDSAITIGNAIENLEGEGTITVSHIEEYCDAVYRTYEMLNTPKDANSRKVHKNLRKQLLRIENSVKNDIPIRREIAFFPYKASMWDSLESVYLKEKEDPDCDVYCVPIPYFELNQDKSLGVMHYEGNEFPKNIEIIDWQSYNFEGRRPDSIYIHNPYDNWNLVTSVHPRFYSNNLKKYTDELVYIPYFILADLDPNDKEKVENVKHFCFLPGIINADKVIVQSEKMRKIYIESYIEEANSLGFPADRKKLEDKIFGAVSPKIEKVRNTKMEDIEIPEDWLQIIKRADGSWKKIILYNTGVTALLQNEDMMLDKIRSVFKLFKERQDKVVLLWRPHPLLVNTIKSMRPQLCQSYEKIVEKYRCEGWGIYDDSADLNRAIVLSDGYYGDASSVVQLCQEVKKPILMQDVDADYYHRPFSKVCLWKGNKIYYPLANYNLLCSTDICTGETDVIEKNNKDNGDSLFTYVGIYQWRNYYILSPGTAIRPALAIYNRDSREWTYISVEEEKREWLMFEEDTIYEFGKYLYIFPGLMVITRIDTEKWIVEYFFYPDIEVGKNTHGQVAYVDGKVYIPLRHDNKIYEFDLQTERFESFVVDTELQGIDTLSFDGKVFWMTGIGKMLCSWNKDMGECTSYKNFPVGFQKYDGIVEGEEGYWFWRSVVYDNTVYFVPFFANMMIEFRDGELTKVDIPQEEENEITIHRKGRSGGRKYWEVKQKDNKLMLISAKNRWLDIIDLDTKKVDIIKININDWADEKKLIQDGEILYERRISLLSFLDMILEKS